MRVIGADYNPIGLVSYSKRLLGLLGVWGRRSREDGRVRDIYSYCYYRNSMEAITFIYATEIFRARC